MKTICYLCIWWKTDTDFVMIVEDFIMHLKKIIDIN